MRIEAGAEPYAQELANLLHWMEKYETNPARQHKWDHFFVNKRQ